MSEPAAERISVLSIEALGGRTPGAVLASARSFEVEVEVEAVHCLSDGITRLIAGGIDAVLLDAGIEDVHCIQMLRLVREVAQGLPVVILCEETDSDELVGLRAIRLGAQDCIMPRDLEPERLLRAVVHAIERNRGMDECRRLSFDLEGAIAKRNQDLERANRELETFNYTVSHDLRSPLCAIIGAGELLLEEHGDELPKESLRLVQRMVRSGLKMEEMVDAFLDLALAGGSELCPAAVDLSVIAREALLDLGRRYPERRVEALVAQEVMAEGDPALLGLVVGNLIGNAWKFGELGEGSLIEFGRFEIDGEEVFFVRDDGPGFDPAVAPLLFKPFSRFETRIDGSGVGLATVDRAVRRHGGRVWAEGRPGEGATFFFTLGRAPVKGHAAQDRQSQCPTPLERGHGDE